MSTATAIYPTRLYEWLRIQPELHEPNFHEEALAWVTESPFDGCTSCSCAVATAS